MPKRDAPPPAIVEKTSRGLVPVSALDGEILEPLPIGQIFDAVPRARKRSNEQLRFYWALLGKLVTATAAEDFWPTSAHLHDLLVRRAGFVRPVLDPATGEWVEARDSIALDAMSPADFNAYMDRAAGILSQALGFDVLDLLPPRRKP